MDISSMGTVLSIVVICYLIGMIVKQIRAIPDSLIPIIVGIAVGVIAIPGMYLIPEFPASDIISAIAVGIVSGLVSTGVNQAWKQTMKSRNNQL